MEKTIVFNRTLKYNFGITKSILWTQDAEDRLIIVII